MLLFYAVSLRSRLTLPQLARPQILELHAGTLQVMEHAAAFQGTLDRLHHGTLVGSLSAELPLRILGITLFIQLGVTSQIEAGVAGVRNDELFELCVQVVSGNQLVHNAHLLSVRSQPAALLGIARAAAVPPQAGGAVASCVPALTAAQQMAQGKLARGRCWQLDTALAANIGHDR